MLLVPLVPLVPLALLALLAPRTAQGRPRGRLLLLLVLLVPLVPLALFALLAPLLARGRRENRACVHRFLSGMFTIRSQLPVGTWARRVQTGTAHR